MTLPDDQPPELHLVDADLDDGAWATAGSPAGPDPRFREVTALLAAARGPATADELAAEHDVVAAMQQVLEASRTERGRRGVPTIVGRAVAAKGVAAVAVVAFGVATAAAATGVVAAVVHPAGDGEPPIEMIEAPATTAVPVTRPPDSDDGEPDGTTTTTAADGSRPADADSSMPPGQQKNDATSDPTGQGEDGGQPGNSSDAPSQGSNGQPGNDDGAPPSQGNSQEHGDSGAPPSLEQRPPQANGHPPPASGSPSSQAGNGNQ